MNAAVPMVTVGELIARGEADIQTGPFGTQLKASEYVDFGTPVINVRNVGFGDIRDSDLEFITEAKAEKLAAHRLRSGDVVFGRKGAVERHALIAPEQDGWVQGSDCIRLRLASNAICERYVSYYLRTRSHQDWMQALCSFGATMASLNHDIVKRIAIPLPDFPTQSKIAAILTAYDDQIETNKRRITLLEKMAEELYREWFVRMRFPGHRDTKFVKGVPEGWDSVTVGDLVRRGQASLQTGPFGTYLKASEYVDEGTPVINVRNIGNGRLRADKLEFLSEAKVAQLHQHVLKAGDIVFGRKGAVERHLLVSKEEDGWIQGSDCIRLRLSGAPVSSRYLSLIFKQSAHQEWMMNQCSGGATMASLNERILSRIAFYVPYRAVSEEFDRIAEPIFRNIDLLYSQTETLSQTRDLLLPRLISGKLSVENLDVQFPPSMQEESTESEPAHA